MIIKNSINKFMIIRYLKNPLFKNSLYILLTSTSSAGFGFIFWSLAAKYATAENVGVATALFSSMGLIILISRIG
jgi:O-antigen/teichoic acid export membrane protein